jgi:hypothetical protein
VARQALPLLPRLAAALRKGAALGPPAAGLSIEDSHSLPLYCLSMVQVLGVVACFDPGEDAAQFAAWCAVPDALLRLAPLLADLQLQEQARQRAQGLRQQPGRGLGREPYAGLAHSALGLWRAVGQTACPDVTPALATALRQLHATGCRLVHWTAGAAAAPAAASAAGGPGQGPAGAVPQLLRHGDTLHLLQHTFWQAMEMAQQYNKGDDYYSDCGQGRPDSQAAR